MPIGKPRRRPGNEILMDVEIGRRGADCMQMRARAVIGVAAQHARSPLLVKLMLGPLSLSSQYRPVGDRFRASATFL
jgi:hypothetical protein